jgi:hypothetical protein
MNSLFAVMRIESEMSHTDSIPVLNYADRDEQGHDAGLERKLAFLSFFFGLVCGCTALTSWRTARQEWEYSVATGFIARLHCAWPAIFILLVAPSLILLSIGGWSTWRRGSRRGRRAQLAGAWAVLLLFALNQFEETAISVAADYGMDVPFRSISIGGPTGMVLRGIAGVALNIALPAFVIAVFWNGPRHGRLFRRLARLSTAILVAGGAGTFGELALSLRWIWENWPSLTGYSGLARMGSLIHYVHFLGVPIVWGGVGIGAVLMMFWSRSGRRVVLLCSLIVLIIAAVYWLWLIAAPNLGFLNLANVYYTANDPFELLRIIGRNTGRGSQEIAPVLALVIVLRRPGVKSLFTRR